MLLLTLNLMVGTPEVVWHEDYGTAVRAAMEAKKDLFIHFRDDATLDAALDDDDVRKRLGEDYVCLRVPSSYKHEDKRLLDYSAFGDMLGKPGLVIASLHDKELTTYQHVISAHSQVGSRYRWAPQLGADEVRVILDLPRTATLSQRSMIYAIRVHPERPQSVYGEARAAFLGHAERHSARQASMQHQHHADLIGSGIGANSEVVAESWGAFVGGENVLEASFSCVDAWRQSPGHWGAVSRAQRYFGYDIARGANGTWYATGVFGN